MSVDEPSQTPLPVGRSQPALRALDSAELHTLESVAGEPASQLLALHGLGPTTIRILDEALESRGLPALIQ